MVTQFVYVYFYDEHVDERVPKILDDIVNWVALKGKNVPRNPELFRLDANSGLFKNSKDRLEQICTELDNVVKTWRLQRIV